MFLCHKGLHASDDNTLTQSLGTYRKSGFAAPHLMFMHWLLLCASCCCSR